MRANCPPPTSKTSTGWDGANANLLIPGDQHDPGLGVPAVRSQLCKIYKAEEPPFVWEAPYYGTTNPPGPKAPPPGEAGDRPGSAGTVAR